ncbi:MAG: protein translocase subunit SecD [Cyanobacteria bacterium J06626_14]
MGRQRTLLTLILALALVAAFVIIRTPIPLGLDLRGGSQLTLQVQTTEAVPNITDEKLLAVQQVVENRINGLGVAEAVVQTAGGDQLIIQLPGVSDPEQAERVLGGTAQLEFREQQRDTELQTLGAFLSQREAIDFQADTLTREEYQTQLQETNQAIAALFQPATITGDRLRNASVQPLPNGASWEVTLEFDNQGGREFAELTKNVAGTGRTLGIFLDNVLLSAPTVGIQYAETGIVGGRASISGSFTFEQANELAIQLEGGALPVPVEIVENRTVGATLGQASVRRSLYAGVGGLLLVLVFMVVYYRLPGAIANIALIIYATLTFAVFSLIQVTLTLPGIAGFILSIGMAVDANVLIFERTREELKAGRTLYRSVESGFYRAFSSILDSNITTLIVCGALFWLGTGLVKGFALTLAIGVLISMFTALTCSRTLLLIALSIPSLRKPELFCPNLDAIKQAPTQASSG